MELHRHVKISKYFVIDAMYLILPLDCVVGNIYYLFSKHPHGEEIKIDDNIQ